MENDLFSYASLAGAAYDGNQRPGDRIVGAAGFSVIVSRTDVVSGYNGVVAYNKSTNTLVVASGGTNTDNPVDLQQSYWGVAVGGTTAQVFEADLLLRNAINELAGDGATSPNLVFTGHSLGGIPSQILAMTYPGSKAVVFNSPGISGKYADLIDYLIGMDLPITDVTYVYSEKWGAAGLIHELGVRLSDSIIL